MPDDLTSWADVGRLLGRQQADIDDLKAALATNQLNNASLENTALRTFDDDGTERSRVGKQLDGTYAVIHINGPPPPAPSAPVLTALPNGLRVRWDGGFVDDATLPLDFARVEVHVDLTDGFTPTDDTRDTTIVNPVGASATFATDEYVPHYVRLVAVNTSGAASAASAQRSVVPVQAPADVGPDAIGTIELADGAVATANIQDLAVTGPKIEYLEVEKLTAGTLTAEVVTPGTLKTATAGQRIEIGEGGFDSVINFYSADPAKPKAAVWSLTDNQGFPQIQIRGPDNAPAPGMNAAALAGQVFTAGIWEGGIIKSGMYSLPDNTEVGWRGPDGFLRSGMDAGAQGARFGVFPHTGLGGERSEMVMNISDTGNSLDLTVTDVNNNDQAGVYLGGSSSPSDGPITALHAKSYGPVPDTKLQLVGEPPDFAAGKPSIFMNANNSRFWLEYEFAILQVEQPSGRHVFRTANTIIHQFEFGPCPKIKTGGNATHGFKETLMCRDASFRVDLMDGGEGVWIEFKADIIDSNP